MKFRTIDYTRKSGLVLKKNIYLKIQQHPSSPMRYLEEFEAYKLNEADKVPAKAAAPVADGKDTAKPAAPANKTANKIASKAPLKTIDAVKTEYNNLLENIKKEGKVPTVTIALAKKKLDAVKFLQAFLVVKGYNLKPDGFYGAMSKKAMISYQDSMSLTGDGICGLKTWQRVLKEFGQDANTYTAIKVDEAARTDKVDLLTNASLAKISKTYATIIDKFKQTRTVPLLSDKLSKQRLIEVKLLQDYLLFTKYSTGKVDGQFGKGTKEGVVKLQTKFNIKADGVVGLKTWEVVLKDFGITSLKDFKTTDTVTAETAQAPVGIKDIRAKYINLLNESQKNKKLPLLSISIMKIKLDYVSMTQDYLNVKKYKCGVDGQFGRGTKKAVMGWQTKNKLGADGAIGLKSWAVIMKEFGFAIDGFTTYTPTAPTAAPTIKNASIVQAKEDQSFYTLTAAEDATFMKSTFTTEEGDMTGDKLVTSKYMTTSEIASLIKLNPTMVPLILKKAYVVMGNRTPIKLLMQYPGLREETSNPIVKLGEPRLLGEMVYYGLRGVGSDKGIDTALVIRRVITQLASFGNEKKRDIEAWFNKCAQSGDIEKYRDTAKYPLRKWLYDQFKTDDPYKWMNHITQDSYTLNKDIMEKNVARAKATPKQEPLPLYADDEKLYPQ